MMQAEAALLECLQRVDFSRSPDCQRMTGSGGKPTSRFQAAVGKSRHVPIGRIWPIPERPVWSAQLQ
jgi:hypothetical protein